MITKEITKNLKELKINDENIDFSEASVRLMENMTKVQINDIEFMDVIEWIWEVTVKVHYQSGFNPKKAFDVCTVTKDDEIFEGKAILDIIEINNSSDMHVEEVFLKGIGTLEGFDIEKLK